MITADAVAAATPLPVTHDSKPADSAAAASSATGRTEAAAAADSVPAVRLERDAWMQGLTFSAPGRE